MHALKTYRVLLHNTVQKTVVGQLKRWQSQDAPAVASHKILSPQDGKSKAPSIQSALYVPTGDAEAGTSIVFAVQPYVDLQWLLHESEELFAENLRRRQFDPSKYPKRDSLMRDAKVLSKLQSDLGEIKQQRQHIANEMAKLKYVLQGQADSNNLSKDDVATDEHTRKYAQSMRAEGLRLRSISKDLAAQVAVLEQRVILPALSLPNRLVAGCPDRWSDNGDIMSELKTDSVNNNVEMRNTSPSPYLSDLRAEAELWLLNVILNDLINKHSFIPLSPPSLYQAVVAEGCSVVDPMFPETGDDETTSQSSACAVLFPPSIDEHSYKAHDTRMTYLLCHPCMPTAAFLANAEIPSVSLPAKFAWSARMHLSTPLSRQYKHFAFSQPNVVGWTVFMPSSSTNDRDNALDVMMTAVQGLVYEALNKFKRRTIDYYADAELEWQTAPASELFNEEMIRHCLMLKAKQHGASGRLELARCSLGGTFISKRLKILHALDNDSKKGGAGHVKRNFPADYGFLECIHGVINLSHVASLCSSRA